MKKEKISVIIWLPFIQLSPQITEYNSHYTFFI